MALRPEEYTFEAVEEMLSFQFKLLEKDLEKRIGAHERRKTQLRDRTHILVDKSSPFCF